MRPTDRTGETLMTPEITIKISFAASGDAAVEAAGSTHAIAPPAAPMEAAAEAPPPPAAVEVDEAGAGSSDDVPPPPAAVEVDEAGAGSSDDVPPPPTVDEVSDELEPEVPSLPDADADDGSEG
jgi:hypothetical protein